MRTPRLQALFAFLFLFLALQAPFIPDGLAKGLGPECSPAELARLAAERPPRKTDHLKPVAESKVIAPDPQADVNAFLERKGFKAGSFNVENFFTSVGSFKPDPVTGKRIQVKPADIKPEKARQGVAKAILGMDLDVAVLQEVEVNAAEEFCATDLGGKYTAVTIRGNDGRGIDVVAIVKKGSPLEFTYNSHKNEPFNDPMYPNHPKLFSRDVVALEARLPGHAKPLFVMLGLHGKSKRTDSQADPESTHFREAQGDRLADIAQMYTDKYNAPVIIGGDFNDGPNTSPAYHAIRDMGFKDSLDVTKGAKIPLGDKRRTTHTYHPRGGRTEYSQLDALMMSPNAQDLVMDSQIYNYVDDRGRPMPIPDTFQQREKQPSDHRPVFMTLDLQAMLRMAGIK